MRTGWEHDTPSHDTVVLAGARAIAEGVSRWARAAGGTVTRVGPVVVADAG